MNILVVHEVDWLKKVIYEIQTLSELLSLAGHAVYAIDYESMWQGLGISRYQEMKVARAYQEAAVTLIRPGFVKLPMLSRFSASFTHYEAIEKVLRERDIDVILLYSVPTNGLQTVSLAKQYGIPVVFRSLDVLHKIVSNKLLAKITYLMERKVYSSVDCVLTINQAMARYVVGMKAPKEKVHILPLGVDCSTFHPDDVDRNFALQLGIEPEDKVIVFVGTLPYFSGLDIFIEQFPKILREVSRAKLLIVGDGVQRDELERLVRRLKLQGRVVITGLVQHDEVPKYINLGTVCINTFANSNATRDIFPTKVIQYMACGKPVISYPLAGLVDMICGRKHGMIYTNYLSEETISLLQSDGDLALLGNNALNYVRQNHEYGKVMKLLEDILEGIVESCSN